MPSWNCRRGIIGRRTRSDRRAWRLPNADPHTVPNLSDNSGIHETRHDPVCRVSRDMEEVLQALESNRRFRFVDDVIHDCANDLRPPSAFSSFDSHSLLRVFDAQGWYRKPVQLSVVPPDKLPNLDDRQFSSGLHRPVSQLSAAPRCCTWSVEYCRARRVSTQHWMRCYRRLRK